MTAVGYTRLSQDSDTSIERQERHIRQYATEHGLTLDQIYDDGEQSSGFDDKREQYMLLKERLRADDGVAALVLNDKRRIARDIDEVMRLIPDLRQNEIALHTYQDGKLDLSDPMHAAIEILQAAAAHKEKLEEIEKSIQSVNERLERGYDHGPPRFGMEYRPDGKYQQPADDFGRVQDVWELREDGMSYHEIADELGISSKTAYNVVKKREWYEQRVQMAEG